MAVVLKRDATGLCRCSDGSLAICAACDCSYAGTVDAYIDGVGPFLLTYVHDWSGDWVHQSVHAGSHSFPCLPYASGTSWELSVTLRNYPSGSCLWSFSALVAVYNGETLVGYAIFESMDGMTQLSYCWSGSYDLARNPEIGLGDGWPSAIDIATTAHVEEE